MVYLKVLQENDDAVLGKVFSRKNLATMLLYLRKMLELLIVAFMVIGLAIPWQIYQGSPANDIYNF